jgi:hypothetical protein
MSDARYVVRGGTPQWSYFLRADTMHTLYSYLERNPGRTRVNEQGFYLMDEPDAPLSFTASLGLAALLHDLASSGSQLLVASHSPILAGIPGATLLELGRWGIEWNSCIPWSYAPETGRFLHTTAKLHAINHPGKELASAVSAKNQPT